MSEDRFVSRTVQAFGSGGFAIDLRKGPR